MIFKKSLRQGLSQNCHFRSMFYYLCVRCTGIAAPESRVAGRVLQAKTGFVSLGHFAPSNGVQQVVVTEGVHAVVVSVWNRAGQI